VIIGIENIKMIFFGWILIDSYYDTEPRASLQTRASGKDFTAGQHPWQSAPTKLMVVNSDI
jgi:hypothetical protein